MQHHGGGAHHAETAETSGLPQVYYDDGLYAAPTYDRPVAVTDSYREYAGPQVADAAHHQLQQQQQYAAFNNGGGMGAKGSSDYHAGEAIPLAAAGAGAGSGGGAGAKRYPLGLSKKAFFTAIAVVAVVVIAALAGGIGGGLASSHSSKSNDSDGDDSPSSPGGGGGGGGDNSTTTTPGPLLDSQLAAINYTDSEGTSRYAVFYQSEGALLLSLARQGSGDGDSTTSWTQVNISSQFDDNTGSSAVLPRSGTPLAAAGVPWQGLDNVTFAAHLFFIDETDLVRQLSTASDDLSVWNLGTQWDLADTYKADGGSKLGAVPFYCAGGGCQNDVCVTYQDAEREIWVSCSIDFSVLTSVVDAAFPQSPMATIQFAADDGKNVTNVDELRVFYYSDTAVQDQFFNHDGQSGWSKDPDTIISDVSASSSGTSPQVVATGSDSNSKILVLAQDGASGKILGSWWDGRSWNTNQRASFVNQDGSTTVDAAGFNISSMALDNDHRFYAASSDGTELVEYSWSSDSPFEFSWVSNVISK